MPRLTKMLIMGVMPLFLAAACCCSFSPLMEKLVGILDPLDISPTSQSSLIADVPTELIVLPSFTPTLSATVEETPTPTDSPTATETITPTITPTMIIPASLIMERFVTYDVVQYIELTAEGRGKGTDINMNVALIRSISPYQEVVLREINPPEYTLVTDSYGNEYANFMIAQIDHNETFYIEIRYVVNVYEIRTTLGACQGVLPDTDLFSEKYIEADDPLVVTLEEQLSEGKATVCDQQLAFYDYLVDNMTYGGYNPGELGAVEALRTLEGDCTEFSDSMVALSRSAGIPARFLEGVVCCTNNGYADGKNKHNWLEVYLPELEWVPMDPTWGQQPLERNMYFAGITPDHIIITIGRNLELLGGYHYFYYTYFREAAETNVTWKEEWSILIQ